MGSIPVYCHERYIARCALLLHLSPACVSLSPHLFSSASEPRLRQSIRARCYPRSRYPRLPPANQAHGRSPRLNSRDTLRRALDEDNAALANLNDDAFLSSDIEASIWSPGIARRISHPAQRWGTPIFVSRSSIACDHKDSLAR